MYSLIEMDTLSAPQSRRSAEEVSPMARAAGLTGSGGTGLHFSSQLHSEELQLLEIHGPVLSALKGGEK